MGPFRKARLQEEQQQEQRDEDALSTARLEKKDLSTCLAEKSDAGGGRTGACCALWFDR